MLNEIKIIKPALRIYYFAQKKFFNDNSPSKTTCAFFESVWDACSRVGVKDEHPYLKLPTEFPSVSPLLDTKFQPLAAKSNKKIKEGLEEETDFDQEAIFFEHKDYVALIINIETGSEVKDLSEWENLYKNFGKFIPKPPVTESAVDCFFLYTGISLTDDTKTSAPPPAKILSEEQSEQIVYQNLPPVSTISESVPHFDVFPETLPEKRKVWHKIRAAENYTSLALLTPQSIENGIEKLYGWAIWGSESQMATLVGYLLNLSKLNHAFRVFWNERGQIKAKKNKADEILRAMYCLNKNIAEYGIDLSAEELDAAERELLKAQNEAFDIQFSLTRLREMNRSIKTAQTNIEQYIPRKSVSPNRTDGGFFVGNERRAEKLVEQIDADIEYLQAFQERIAGGHNLTRLFQERESKKIARRLNSLVLWQGSLIGAFGIGLTALQAFEVKPPLKETLFLPLSLFLGVLALTVPALLTHWEDGYGRKDYVIGGVLAAAFAFLLLTVLNSYLPIFYPPYWLWIIHFFATFIAGFFAGWFIIVLLSRFKKKRSQSNFGVSLDDGELLDWVNKFLSQTDKLDESLFPIDFQSKLRLLADSYMNGKTILKKHELLNEAHNLIILKKAKEK